MSLALGVVVCSQADLAKLENRLASELSQFYHEIIIIQHTNLITMDQGDQILRDHSILIEDGIIRKIGLADQVETPHGAFEIDGSGLFVLPGFADMHVHLGGESELLSYLAYGVTTVCDLDGTPQILDWRSQIRAGERIGPDIYCSSPALGARFTASGEGATVELTPTEFIERVRRYKHEGYDFIKVYTWLSDESFEIVAREANALEMAIVGHIPSKSGLVRSLDLGLRMVAHAEELYYNEPFHKKPNVEGIEQVGDMLDAKSVTLIPNVSFIRTILDQIEDIDNVLDDPEFKYLPTMRRLDWMPSNNRYTNRENPEQFYSSNVEMHAFLQRLSQGLHKKGVRYMVGSDASATGAYPGKASHQELKSLVEAGLTPYEALQAGTANAGAFVSETVKNVPRFGVLREGYLGNLVLLGADPTRSISNTLAIQGVVKGQFWFPIDDLRNLRDSRLPQQIEQILRAERLVESEQWLDAVDALVKIVELDGSDVFLWWNLGNAAYQSQQYDLAVEAFEQTLRDTRFSIISSYNAACASALGGNSEQALLWVRRLLEAGFENPTNLLDEQDLKNLHTDERFLKLLNIHNN